MFELAEAILWQVRLQNFLSLMSAPGLVGSMKPEHYLHFYQQGEWMRGRASRTAAHAIRS